MPDSALRQFARTARHPPLWSRWVMTIATFVVAIAVIAIVVRSADTGKSAAPSSEEALAVAEANSEGRTAIAEDEAPHTSRLQGGVAPPVALARAIATDVRSRIRTSQLTGPLQGVRCRASGPPRRGRRPYDCTVRSAGIDYTFVAVADERLLQLTWCKVDPPATPQSPLEVPVSQRCRA
jgi:hypothetical protein